MQVTLISYTREPLSIIYTAARTCYSALSPSEIISQKVSPVRMRTLIRKVVNSGHHSVLEHIVFTFGVSGISRACSHQLVRHRIASYSQQSQRYVNPNEDIIIPPSIAKDKILNREVRKFLSQSSSLYDRLVKNGIPKEDARFVLSNAVATNIVITMNLRELVNACGVRLCNKAQWEIRELFSLMKKSVSKVDKFLGGFLVERCITLGFCPEEDGCGLMPKKQNQR